MATCPWQAVVLPIVRWAGTHQHNQDWLDFHLWFIQGGESSLATMAKFHQTPSPFLAAGAYIPLRWCLKDEREWLSSKPRDQRKDSVIFSIWVSLPSCIYASLSPLNGFIICFFPSVCLIFSILNFNTQSGSFSLPNHTKLNYFRVAYSLRFTFIFLRLLSSFWEHSTLFQCTV